MYQLNYSRDDIHLVGKDIVKMNEYAPAIRATESPQRTQFTMVPNILIDGFDELSDAARFAFIKFMRLVRKVGYFAGSINKLGEKLKVARMTINRMVAAWEKSLLVKIEPIGDTNAVRVIPLTDTLWQANTNRYQQETVTICDTISDTDTSATDTVITKCDTPSQNVTDTVTKCDDIEHEIDRNIDKNISNKNIDTISSTNVEDALPPYKDGLRPKSILKGWLADITLMDDAFLAEMEKMLPPADVSTPLPHTVDTMSHSHVVQATRNEQEQHVMATPAPALQAKSTKDDIQSEHTTMAGATSPPAREMRKRGVGKKAEGVIDITAEGMAVYRDWCSLFKVTVPLNKAIAKAANELVEPLAVWAVVKGCSHKEVLKSIKNWLYENDKNGYYSRGVKLYDIAREFEGWQSKQEQPPSTNGTHATKNEGVRLIGGKPSSELTEAEIEALPTPFLRKAARSARASC